MSKKHIIKIDGKPVEVSEEIYTYITRSNWNNYYAEIKRKHERIRINSKKGNRKIHTKPRRLARKADGNRN